MAMKQFSKTKEAEPAAAELKISVALASLTFANTKDPVVGGVCTPDIITLLPAVPESGFPGTPTTCVSPRSEEHTSELQSRPHLVCRLLLEKKKKKIKIPTH